MLDAAERMEISVLSEHGGSIRSIARATGRSRNTVRRYLRCGDDGPAGRSASPAPPISCSPWRRPNGRIGSRNSFTVPRYSDEVMQARAELAEAIRFGATARPSPA